MLNFRTIYKHAEEHTAYYLGGLFVLLAVLIFLQTIFSPTIVIAGVVGVAAMVMTVLKPRWVLFGLALYLPFESLLLKFVPDDAFLFTKYAPEGLIYLMSGVVLASFALRRFRYRYTPIDLTFLLFAFALVASVFVNLISPSVAILGTRQIVRFMLVFFLIVQLKPSKTYVQWLTYSMFAIMIFQCVLGFMQPILGERLDMFLLPSESRSLGDITLSSGVAQTWDPGSRIFGTLGRYDRLGNFLYVFLLLATGLLFEKKLVKDEDWSWLWWIIGFGIPALVLTYSRASWFAFLIGFLFIGIWIKRDKRIMAVFASLILVVVGYLAITGLSVRYITDIPGQTLTERFFETFSYARWASEYYGLGRVYWDVQTPLVVVPHSLFFGVGPGQFGGGAAAALHNTKIYEELGLPFGVFGTEGYIDNNWFSLWGEIGTIGVLLFGYMLWQLFRVANDVYQKKTDPFVRGLSIGFAALVIAVALNAFTSTLFEIRTLAFYFWMYAGFIVVLSKERSV